MPEETGRPPVEENESCVEPSSQQDYQWIDGETYLDAQPSRPTNPAGRDNESMIAHVDNDDMKLSTSPEPDLGFSPVSPWFKRIAKY
jgi:hypothetical protein